MRLRNDSGYPLELRTYGRVVWPGEEIDTDELGHDMETHGVITGLTEVKDDTKRPSKTAAKSKTDNKPASKETDK